MEAILDLLSNSNLQTGIGALFGGGALSVLGVAKKLGFKPTALIGGLLKRGKNPIKEFIDVVKVFRSAISEKSKGGKEITKDEFIKISKELVELSDSLIPYIK